MNGEKSYEAETTPSAHRHACARRRYGRVRLFVRQTLGGSDRGREGVGVLSAQSILPLGYSGILRLRTDSPRRKASQTDQYEGTRARCTRHAARYYRRTYLLALLFAVYESVFFSLVINELIDTSERTVVTCFLYLRLMSQVLDMEM